MAWKVKKKWSNNQRYKFTESNQLKTQNAITCFMCAPFYTSSIDLDRNQLKSSNHSVRHDLFLRSVAFGGFYSEGMKFMISIGCQMSLAPVSPNHFPHSHTVIFTCRCKYNAPTVEPCPSWIRSRITCTEVPHLELEYAHYSFTFLKSPSPT